MQNVHIAATAIGTRQAESLESSVSWRDLRLTNHWRAQRFWSRMLNQVSIRYSPSGCVGSMNGFSVQVNKKKFQLDFHYNTNCTSMVVPDRIRRYQSAAVACDIER
jgi:hypothetical protein